MDTTVILLQGAVVIIAILLGVRMGGIGLGCGAWSASPSWCSASGSRRGTRRPRRCSSS